MDIFERVNYNERIRLFRWWKDLPEGVLLWVRPKLE